MFLSEVFSFCKLRIATHLITVASYYLGVSFRISPVLLDFEDVATKSVLYGYHTFVCIIYKW
jgi:hypothetical protein